MFVDRYGSRIILTVCEKPDLRRRIQNNKAALQMKDVATLLDKIDALESENENLKVQLEESKKNAIEWEKAADGLARMIEELKSQPKE